MNFEIFHFIDLIQYLNDHYHSIKKSEKKLNRRYNLEKYANLFEYKYNTFIVSVLKRDKELPLKKLDVFANNASLNQDEKLHLKRMYDYTYGKTELIREKAKMEMTDYLFPKSRRNINEDQYEYFSNWYNPVVRDLVLNKKLKCNMKIIGEMMIPNITRNKVYESIKLLQKLGILRKNANGTYIQDNKFLSTGNQLASEVVKMYQKQYMEFASESLDRIPSAERNISNIICSISEKGFEKIIKELNRLKSKIIDISNNENNEGRIYNFGFQIFPITKILPK